MKVSLTRVSSPQILARSQQQHLWEIMEDAPIFTALLCLNHKPLNVTVPSGPCKLMARAVPFHQKISSSLPWMISLRTHVLTPKTIANLSQRKCGKNKHGLRLHDSIDNRIYFTQLLPSGKGQISYINLNSRSSLAVVVGCCKDWTMALP